MKQFDREMLLSTAIKDTGGLSDWGGEDFFEPLDMLLEDWQKEGNISNEGWKNLSVRLDIYLKGRLYSHAALRKNPSIEQIKLPRPLIVVSLPRCGSTHLLNLLSFDPAARSLKLWELLHPYPVDPKVNPDPRLAATLKFLSPVQKAVHMHPMEVFGPDECQWLMNPTFCSWMFTVMAKCNRYRNWLCSRDMTHTYEYYRQRLQLLLHQRPCPEGGHLALKDPVNHIANFELLLKLFPNAGIIFIHRDAKQAVGSFCSLMRSLRPIYSNEPSALDIGEHALFSTKFALSRALEARAKLPCSSFYDLAYDDLVREPQNVIASIYEYFGIPFSPAFSAALEKALVQSREKVGIHKYSLNDFGLAVNEVEKTTSFYSETFSRFLGLRTAS